MKALLKKYRVLIENIFSLFTIRGIEYVLSFLTFPYLVRTVGVSYFGSLAFAQSIITYFSLFTDYGFNMTAPRDIARHDQKEARGKVFAAVFGAKLFLLALTVLPLLALLLFLGARTTYSPMLFAITYLSVVGNVISPVWFFQGIQQMRYITLVNTVARITTALGIFSLVRSPEDYLWAAFLQSVPGIIAGAVSWWILFKRYPEVFQMAKWEDIKLALKDGWDIFVSTIAINIYTVSNTVILGMMTNSMVVGYFSSAQKIVNAVQRGLQPVTQAIYPHISKLFEESQDSALRFIRKIMKLYCGGNLGISLILLFGANPIMHLLMGKVYGESVQMLRALALLPFIVSLSQIFGIQTMLPCGMNKEFSRIIISSAILNTIMVFPLIYLLGGTGVCWSMLVTETFVTMTMGWTLHNKGILV